jgi:hypothetical protein
MKTLNTIHGKLRIESRETLIFRAYLSDNQAFIKLKSDERNHFYIPSVIPFETFHMLTVRHPLFVNSIGNFNHKKIDYRKTRQFHSF